DACAREVCFLKSVAGWVLGVEGAVERGQRLGRLTLALVGETQTIVANAEQRLGGYAPAERVDGGVELALLQIGPTEISPSIFRGLVEYVRRQRPEHRDRVGVLLPVDEHDAQCVAGFAVVFLYLDRPARMALCLWQPAIVGCSTTEIQVQERH